MIMSTVTPTDDPSKLHCACLPVPIKRPALILTLCTMADCPIGSVCVNREKEDARPVRCGHYLGSNTNINGSQVTCAYLGR
jgi:hypothetical protein